VETALELAQVLLFIQTLPEIDRAALALRLQGDLSYEEIARVLGVSLAAAKVRVHRARMKLSVYRFQQEETQR
jgi:DNA-directed RNA polymerase specialized sigma24 family protein